MMLHLPLNAVPLTFAGFARHNVENCAAAIGAMWAMGVPSAAISSVLQAFAPDLLWNPGRQNIIKVAKTTVMLDYGHNVPGISAIAELARRLCNGRLIGVIAAPGDRNDETIVQLGKAIGLRFDQVFVKEDMDLRGRRPGEAARLLRHGLAEAGRGAAGDEGVLDEATVLRQAILSAAKEDWVIIFYETLEATLEQLRQMENEASEAFATTTNAEAVGG